MTAPPVDPEYAGVDQYFAQDDALDDSLVDAGVDEIMQRGQPPAGGAPDPMRHTQPIPGGGALLEEADWKKVYKSLDQTILRQKRLATNREQEEITLKRIVRGVPFAYTEKSEDRSVYKAALPPFVDDITQPVPNKVADLKKKVISQMLADPFLPNPKADGDTDKDRGAADVTKKFLRADGTAAGTNDGLMLRENLSINMTGKSAFQFAWVDPTGGGWRPMQIKADPLAEDPTRPLYGPKINSATGLPMVDADGKKLMLERTSNPLLRYVAEDKSGKQTFVEDAAAAARQWMPKIRRTTLYPNQVRTVPATANAFDALQILVLMWEPLGEARKRFPILSELGTEQLAKLCNWRPKWWKSVVPEAYKVGLNANGGEDRTKPTDDSILFWVHSFCRIGAAYIDGAEIAVSGADGGFGLKRDTLREDVQLDDGTHAPVLMDPPIAQFICLQDTDTGDAWGYSFVKDFEGGNEAYATIWMGMLEAVDKALHRNTMIPATSPITGPEWRRRDDTPLEILTKDDEPSYEQAPEIPSYVADMLERIELVMNSEAQTNETSNGLDSQYSVSGVAKEVAIKQARTGLAQYWQNTVNGLLYWWRIKTQLAKARYTVPMQVKLSGIESAYKQPWWIGSDLFGVSDVALEPGSGTMMNPTEKVQLVGVMQNNKFIDPEQAGELARSTMTDDLGLPPNIHEERINRCIATWANGPPEGFWDLVKSNQAATTNYQTAIQQRVAALTSGTSGGAVDPQTAQAQAQQEIPAPQLAELPSPFDPRPNDIDPAVALIQYRRLNRMASTAEYSKHEVEWRQVFDKKFTAARQAAGVQSVDEKQQQDTASAQNQRYLQFVQAIDQKVQGLVELEIAKVVNGAMAAGPAGEASAAAREQEFATGEKAADREHQIAENEKDRELKKEIHARDAMSKEAIAARREPSPAQTAARQPVAAART